MKRLLQLLMLLIAYHAVRSQSGSLDTNFGQAGKSITTFNSPATLHALALQSNGKIVAAGTTNGFFTLVRYNSNGLTDNSFGNNGIVTGIKGEANAAAVQDNGKIVVAGYTYSGVYPNVNYNVAMARYNSSGSLDKSFGNNGVVVTDIRKNDYCNAVVIQNDGKIVVAGTTAGNNYTHALLIRYNKDGSLDYNFGDSGKVVTKLDKDNYVIDGVISSLALQSDGKILIGGVGTDAGSNTLYTILIRYKRNGEIDKNFGNAGRVSFFPQFNINAIAIQTNDEIVCAGNIQNDDYYDVPALRRYTPDGKIDSTYASNGDAFVFPYNRNDDAQLYSIALPPDNKSVSMLQYYFPPEGDITVAAVKYQITGKEDPSFGKNGKTAFHNNNFNGRSYPSFPVILQPDGKIVFGATYNNNKSFYITRLLGEANIIKPAQSAVIVTQLSASIYPNPVDGNLFIKGINMAMPAMIMITNLSGNIMQEAELAAGQRSINVSLLPPGSYIAVTKQDNKKVSLKFIKR